MSIDWFSDVREFHEKFEVPVRDKPTSLPLKELYLCESLIGEELDELISAATIEEFADGLTDLVYVIVGTAVQAGIDLRPVWDEVHAANMRKDGGGRRDDGKILKPAGWQPPDIAAALKRGEWRR